MVEKGIRDLLINDPTIGPMVGGSASPFTPGTRVRPILLPEGSSYPAISYSVVASTPLTSMDGVNALQTKRFQIDCWGKNPVQAKTLAKAVHFLLDGFRGTLSEGSVITSCLPNQDVDTFEYDPQAFRILLDFNVKFYEFPFPNGEFPLGYGTRNTRSLTAGTYNVFAGDLLLCDTTAGDVILVFPLSALNAHQSVVVKRVSSDDNQVVLEPTGTDSINDFTGVNLSVDAVIIADGNNAWWAIY